MNLRNEKFTRRFFLKLIAVSSAWMAMGTLKLADAKQDIVILLGRPSDGDTMDPANSNFKANHINNEHLYERLVFPGVEGDRCPWLVEELEHSEDFTEWIFKVKTDQGIKFHCGKSLTVEDVKVTLDRLLYATRISSKYQKFANKESITIINDHTIKIKLTKPVPLFGSVETCNHSFGVICSKCMKENATEDDPWAFDWFSKNACGTGPFKLKYWNKGEKVVYEKFSDYWGGPKICSHHPRKAYSDKLIHVVIKDSAARKMALEKGTIDIASYLTGDQIKSLEKQPGIKIYNIPLPNITYIGFDVRATPFNNEKVRKAIAYAINYEEIIKGPEQGFAERIYSLNDKGFLGYSPDEYLHYNYDPEKSKKLLKEGGYPNGFSTTLTFGVERRQQFEEEAVYLQSYLKDVGIEVKLQNVAFASQNEMTKGKYEGMVLHTYQCSGGDPDVCLGWRIAPSRKANWAYGWDICHWDDPVAYYTQKAGLIADQEKRAELYNELSKVMMNKAIAIPLYTYGVILAARDNIDNLFYHPRYTYNWWEVQKR